MKRRRLKVRKRTRKYKVKFIPKKKRFQKGKGIGDVADGIVNIAGNLWKDLFGWI